MTCDFNSGGTDMNEKAKEVKKEEAGGKSLATRGGWLSPFEDIDRFFDEAFTSRWPSLFGREWPDFPRLRWPAMPEMRGPFEGRWPKVDVIDRDAEVVVRAELPGVKKEDLDVTTTDTTVTIKAVTEKEEKEEKGQ